MENLTTKDFDEKIKKGITLVDFYAVWCGPCRMQAPILEEVEEHYKDKVLVCKLNVDDEQEIAIKYNVMSIPTMIIFKDGEVSHKYIGLTDKEEIIEKIDSIM
ncbi:MAG: thioredoxin [Clostridia bacterium]|nr:thioredoxin [Clostridia bacterium]